MTHPANPSSQLKLGSSWCERHASPLETPAFAGVTRANGVNNPRIAEAAFKGVARASREAVEFDPRKAGVVPSTKGVL